MKARIRFVKSPDISKLPYNLICPCILTGRAENRHKWSVCVNLISQLNAFTYDCDIKWLIAPIEQDFGKGIKFTLLLNPKAMVELATGELLG